MTDAYGGFYRGRRVLITGGLGFIGSNLARQLVELGADVLIIDAMLADYGGNLFNIDGIERARSSEHRRRADAEHDGRPGPKDREVIFNLAGQVSHIDSMRDPYTGSRHQLPRPAVDPRGLPRAQSRRARRVRRHTPGVRPSRLPAGGRAAPGAAGRHQRRQQVGRRVLPPALQQRLRRTRLLAPADQRLRTASAHQTQSPGLHRLVHPPGARGRRDPDFRRRLADA